MHRRFRAFAVLTVVLLFSAGANPARTDTPVNAPLQGQDRVDASRFPSAPLRLAQSQSSGDPAQISGDPAKPRRHFRLRNAAQVEPDEALEIYRQIGDEMAAGYQGSGDPVASAYRRWRIYNSAPYRSSAHGNRYVNNYANDKARAYGRFEDAGRMPVGAVLAKDSFSVTEDGDVFSAPLFLMEKMPANFNYVSGDWRYAMIMPDGSVYGVTKGENAERVEFCIGCHLAVENQDHLYFLPERFRVVPGASE